MQTYNGGRSAIYYILPYYTWYLCDRLYRLYVVKRGRMHPSTRFTYILVDEMSLIRSEQARITIV